MRTRREVEWPLHLGPQAYNTYTKKLMVDILTQKRLG